jgi:mannose/fructose/N-acetylgalactosamine-specific phosphotransferase system component IID
VRHQRPGGELTDAGRPAARVAIVLQRSLNGEFPMLMTIFVVLLILWLLGMVSSYTLGGYIHLLLIIALVVILVRVIQGRNPV